MAVGQNSRDQVLTIVQEIKDLLATKDTRPIFHRAIDSSKGIQITGTFKTTHPTIPSPMSYITVRRRSDKAVCADGIGLAWRTGEEASGQYNVYLVDNNILTDDMPIRLDNMIIEENINNFLAYGISNIESNVTYKFGLEIDSTWGMKVCIYSGSAAGSPNFSSAYDAATNVSGYIMSLGSRLDGYEPQSSGTHFGISVLGTDGHDWVYDDIRITSIVDGYVASLFKLYADPAHFNETAGARLTMIGAGQGSPGQYGMAWYIWSNAESSWELMATNSGSSTATSVFDIAVISGYLDGSNYINVMAIVDDAASDGQLNIDYVKLSTTPASGIHTGHMTDIYVHAPTAITRQTANLTGITGNIVELDTLTHPIYQIEEVYYTAGGPVYGALTRNSSVDTGRYAVINNSPNYTYSVYEDLSLSVPLNANISVVYTAYADGVTIQEFLEDESNRTPGSDNLLKIAPPAVITINQLDFRGPLTAVTVQSKIALWINDLIRENFEITDLINYLYGLGITYIDLSTLDIVVTVYDYDGTISADNVAITTSYSLEAPNTFYTDTSKLLGVTKL